VAVIFAILVAIMIFVNTPFYRALWAIPLILIFQASFILNKIEHLKKQKKLKEMK